MDLKKIRIKKENNVRKEMDRRERVKRMQIADRMIRKLDQQITMLKDYNQKHPEDAQLIPGGNIHKILVR